MHLPCDNNAIKVPPDSAVLLPSSFKARKLLVERADRKSGKKWVKIMKPS